MIQAESINVILSLSTVQEIQQIYSISLLYVFDFNFLFAFLGIDCRLEHILDLDEDFSFFGDVDVVSFQVEFSEHNDLS